MQVNFITFNFLFMFKKESSIELLNERSQNTMVDHLGIEFLEIGEDYITAKMPVDNRTVQPLRILHGGASLAFAETLGSMAAFLCIDEEKQYCLGLEINANHIRSVEEGSLVIGKAKALHIGRKTHVWEIKISNSQNKLVCTSRITMMIMDKEN